MDFKPILSPFSVPIPPENIKNLLVDVLKFLTFPKQHFRLLFPMVIKICLRRSDFNLSNKTIIYIINCYASNSYLTILQLVLYLWIGNKKVTLWDWAPTNFWLKIFPREKTIFYPLFPLRKVKLRLYY